MRHVDDLGVLTVMYTSEQSAFAITTITNAGLVLMSVDGAAEELFQIGLIAFKAGDRRLNHLFLGNARPVQRMSVAETELADKLALGPSIAFPESMNGIDVAQVIGGAVGEAIKIGAGEVALVSQLSERLVERRSDVFC